MNCLICWATETWRSGGNIHRIWIPDAGQAEVIVDAMKNNGWRVLWMEQWRTTLRAKTGFEEELKAYEAWLEQQIPF